MRLFVCQVGVNLKILASYVIGKRSRDGQRVRFKPEENA